jgi:hypothetical protein
MPIIVGVARSGTTLLRLMLDAHPELAIGPETHFLVPLSALPSTDVSAQAVYDTIVGHPTWVDFDLDAARFHAALSSIDPFNVADACRCFYTMYAGKFGKIRVGDKTPTYTTHMPQIQKLLPEAHFVHLIRDGRDVALSLREMWFAPSQDLQALARYWANNVQAARRSAPLCTHYIEVKYEELITDTAAVLQDLCAFLQLPYSDDMLRYHERAQMRLDEHKGRKLRGGRELSKAERLAQQSRTLQPLQRALVFHWKQSMSRSDQQLFAQVAGDLLQELGYETT